MAVNCRPRNIAGADTGEYRVFRIHHALLQRHGGGDHLEGGTGLVCLRNKRVVPHLVHELLFVIGAFLLRTDKQIVQLLIFLVQIAVIVQVVGGIYRGGKYFAVRDIHHDTFNAAVRFVLLICLLDILFDTVLHRPIDRRDDIQPVRRGDIA